MFIFDYIYFLNLRPEPRPVEAVHAVQVGDSVRPEQQHLRPALGQEVEQELSVWGTLETDEGVNSAVTSDIKFSFILRCNIYTLYIT